MADHQFLLGKGELHHRLQIPEPLRPVEEGVPDQSDPRPLGQRQRQSRFGGGDLPGIRRAVRVDAELRQCRIRLRPWLPGRPRFGIGRLLGHDKR